MSPSNVEESVRSIVNDQRQLEVRSDLLSKEIQSDQMDMAGLIESLGFALSSTELELRLASTNLLSTILTKLPADKLSAAQLQFIVTFYCDRLKDHHSVAPAVFTGILAIVQMTAFPAGSASRVLHSMFQHISCQSQVREDRQKIFNILRVVCSTHVEELLGMGTDMVYGVINAIDGERDPRILLYIFEFVPHFVRTYPLGHLTEEMFEVCACYFPVDFHPSPDDPASITRDRLAGALAKCLAGHADFAEFCLPLLLEKLDSQLSVAKLDSLELLRLAAETFRAQDVEKEFPTIWTALHAEIIAGSKSSSEIPPVALRTLQSIVRSGSTTGGENTCAENILRTVFQTIMGSLSDVVSTHFEVSMQIAVACAQASKFASAYVCGKVLPLLLSEVAAYEENAPKTASIYAHMTQTIEACIQFEAVDQIDVESLSAYHDKLIAGLVPETNRSAVLLKTSLVCLAKHVRALNPSNRSVIYARLNELLIDAPSDVGQLVNGLLFELAQHNADEVKDTILNRWLHADDLSATKAKPIVATVAGLVRIASFTEICLQFLFRHIFERNNEPIEAIALDSLKRIMLDMSAELFDYLYGPCDIVGKLVAYVRTEGKQHSGHQLCTISSCIRTVVKRLAASEQSSVIGRYLPGIDIKRTEDVFLAVGLVSYASVDTEALEKLLRDLTQVCLTVDETSVVEICQQTVCSLANKAGDSSEANAVLENVVKTLEKDVAQGNVKALGVLSWLAKGLTLRGQQTGFNIVDLLNSRLDDKSPMHEQALNGFDVITADVPDLHLPVTRFLHRQKLLQFVLERTVAAPTDVRLRAFAFVLRSTPIAVLSISLTKIVPLLFKGCAVGDPVAVQIFIDVIDAQIGNKSDVILGHLSSLVPLYLRLCSFKGSMKIRVAALQGILGITKYPTVNLQPFKQDVLYALAGPLDDPKRLVRNAAVVARNKWFLV